MPPSIALLDLCERKMILTVSGDVKLLVQIAGGCDMFWVAAANDCIDDSIRAQYDKNSLITIVND